MLPDGRIAEEAGDADEQFLVEKVRFLRILPEITHVIGDLGDLMKTHAPFNPAGDGAFLVEGKIVAGLRTQENHHLFEGALVPLGHVLDRPGNRRDVPEIVDDFAGQLLDRGDHVGEPGLNGHSRHAVEFGRRRRLNKDGPGFFLDGPQPQRAVRTHAREDDPYALFMPVIGQGAKKEIDRQTQTPRRGRLEQMQDAAQNGEVPVGRNDVNMVGLDFHPILDLDDGHARGPLQKFHHDALMGRVEMLDDDKAKAALLGYVPEKLFQGFQAAGGSAKTDDGKGRA